MSEWRKRENQELYTDSEVASRLKAQLPHWYYEKGWIRRKYKTSQGGMYEKHNAGRLNKGALNTGKIKEVAVIMAAWLMALALVYMVIVKMSILFH